MVNLKKSGKKHSGFHKNTFASSSPKSHIKKIRVNINFIIQEKATAAVGFIANPTAAVLVFQDSI